MDWQHPDPTVEPDDSRPIGPAGHCTYCREPVGGDHKDDCVIMNQRRHDAAPREWLPIETYIDGYHALFYFPNGERGVGGIETALAYRDDDRMIRSGWSHGGPNSGSDFDFCEPPTYWMPLPEPPASVDTHAKRQDPAEGLGPKDG